MSLASSYASSIQTVQASAPAIFAGPQGLMTAKVDEQGNCLVTLNGVNYTVPAAAAVSFATWITTTFI